MFDTTIVIPTKNRLKMLLRAIDSISKQSVLPNKVIVIDDCSDEKIVLNDFIEYGNLDIEVINNNKSFGGAYSRNMGVKNATTKYITFLDDDDLFDIDYLKEVKLEIDKTNIEKIAFYSSKRFVLSSSLETVFRENIATSVVSSNDLILNNAVGTTSCVTVARNLLEEVGFFDETLPAFQDYDCWLRLAFNGVKFHPVSSAFVYYTINISSNQISGNFNNHINARRIILDKFNNIVIKETYFQLNTTLSFFTAKSIHRKNYFLSLKYILPIISKKPKSLALLVPYKILNKFGIYTS